MWLAIAAGVWVLVIAASRVLLTTGPRRGDIDAGLFFWVAVLYARLLHRLRVEGREHIPRTGPLIVVANHTGGVDPILIQVAVPRREIRWMMARDMMIPRLRGLWEWMRVIPVVRSGASGDSGAAREALRHLKDGGVLGVFPEGAIERPPGILRPFAPGVGLLAARSGAPVLPVVITGTPAASSAWGSLFRPSRSRIRILPPVCYAQENLSPEAIAADLLRRIAEASGWPVGGPMEGTAGRVGEAGGAGEVSRGRRASS